MKKIIFKFLSLFLAVVVLMSCCVAVPVSAEDEPLLTSFGSVPLDRKSIFLTDDGYVYKYCFLVRLKSDYKFYMFGKKNYDSSIDDISYLNLSSSTSTYYCNSDGSSVKLSYAYLSFRFDSTFNVSNIYSSNSCFSTGYYYAYGGSTVENFVDNIIYSDFPVKYNGLTVYDPSKNKGFEIEDFISRGGGNGGTDDNNNSFAGTTLYGSYVQKNDETLKAFCQWLIDTGKYKDLAQYGFNVSANNLYNVVDCWWDNKFSPALFWELFKTNGLNSISSASSVIGWFSARWSEYVSINNAVVEIPYSENDTINMHHRATDVTEDVTETVTDENGNISTVVVQQKDTETLLVLREILRQIINLPVNCAKSTYSFFYALLSNIADNVYSLCLSVSELPRSIYNFFSSSLTDVINAINNIDFSSDNNNITNNNINVDVNFNNDVDYNVTFGDIEMTLNNKFAFYKQLTEVKNVFENADFSEEKPTIETPEISLSDTAVISSAAVDFSLFDQYRTMIHSIIIAVAYVNFFISLLHRLPDVIGGI